MSRERKTGGDREEKRERDNFEESILLANIAFGTEKEDFFRTNITR